MDKYNLYLNDPYFMKWIFNPDSLTEKYWGKYLQEHPEEEYYISQLKEDLHLLKLKNEDFSEEEKKILLQSILKRKDQPAKVVKFRKVANKLMRYAAVAILFLIIGNAIMYLYLNNKPKSIDFAALDYNLPVDKPTLFLPDGSDIKLDNTSTIEYNTENKIIVDDRVVEVAENDKDEVIFNHAIIPYGSRSRITLADNTVVHLNAGSKLIYPSVFKNNKREVVLFGEAFFEVAQNKEKPFIVKTTSLSIEVLGTKFNVSSYFEDNIIQTVLVEGEVSVKRNDAPFYEKSIILKPNQMLAFNKKTKEMARNAVEHEYFTLWTDGILKFEDKDFCRIIKRLERFYNIKMQFNNPLQGGIKVSGKLDLNENKYEVFEFLTTLTNMKIEEINANTFIIK